MQAVAEGWGLSERHGAPVVDVLDALVGALRDRMRTEAAVETALANAEPDRLILPFAMAGSLPLLELLPRHQTAHRALLVEIVYTFALALVDSARRLVRETAPPVGRGHKKRRKRPG